MVSPFVPPLLAIVVVVLFDFLTRRRGLLPPAFVAEADSLSALGAATRRFLAGAILVVVLWVGVFAPLATLGTAESIDLDAVQAPQLFVLHSVLVAAALGWWLLGYAGYGSGLATQLGLRARWPLRELAIGVAAGVAAWALVIVVLLASALILFRLGVQDLVPDQPPALVAWLAALPLGLRVAVSLSAGLSEELFFRGFLQPRGGIVLSSALFVLAHLSYDQPFMLVGITLLSIVFALLVRWRQNIWAAVTAHATFDAVQLTFVIPWALEQLENARPG